MAGSVFRAGEDNRDRLRRDRRHRGLRLRQDGALLREVADSPAKGPFPAPADVLVTDPPYRSEQAATEADPFAAVYAADVELPEQAGRRTPSWP